MDYVDDKAAGGVRMNFKFEYMEDWVIPLPDIYEQAEIVKQIEKQKAIIEGADLILKNWESNFILSNDWEKVKVKDACKKIFTGNTPSGKVKDQGEIPFLKVNNLSYDLSINYEKTFSIDQEVLESDLKNIICESNDVLMNIVGPPMGKVSVLPNSIEKCATNQNIIAFRTSKRLLPRYLGYFLLRHDTIDELIADKRGVVGQWFVNKTMCGNIEIPLPGIEVQQEIVADLDKQVAALSGIQKMKSAAEQSILSHLTSIWGETDLKTSTKV